MVFGEQGVTADHYDDWHWKVLAEALGHLIKTGVAVYSTLQRTATVLNKNRQYHSRNRDNSSPRKATHRQYPSIKLTFPPLMSLDKDTDQERVL
jgi:hypothetical protein